MDFVATLLTAVLHPQRLLWSRQIEDSSDRLQSEAVVQPVSANYSRWATPGTAADEFDATFLTFKTLS
jgi:hypothetical protein